MKRKLKTIFPSVLILLLVFLNSEIIAKEKIEWSIDNFKYVYSDKTEYGIEYNILSNGKKLEKLLIRLPNRKKMELKNKLRFDVFDVRLRSSGMSNEEFIKKFPEGKYQITLYPKKYGSVSAVVNHEFPQEPEITSPIDNSDNVSLTPVVTWLPLGNVDSLDLYLKGKGLEEEKYELSTDATSYDFSDNPLVPNTKYELRLEAKNTDGNTNIITGRVIKFTTQIQ